ncbi:MAG: hypothetical protein FWC95_05845 [Defluviitaleaceae bacterium]|nr:hypothetical protein [Defluviitaleaceae bacterium]
MTLLEWILVGVGAVALIFGVLFLLNRWAAKKQVGSQQLIEQTKQRADIYVIDKKRDKAENVALPKAVQAQMPKMAKIMKLCFVKAKVGPQIVTLMCDKNVYNHVELKKTYKVELAGMYIVSVKGMKSVAEQKAAGRQRKLKAKEAAKENNKAI